MVKMITARDFSKVFPVILKNAREAKGWTQEKCEAETGIKQGLISKYEDGKIIPGTINFLNLHAHLRFSPAQILTKIAESFAEEEEKSRKKHE